ncbi:MAG TPA: phage terminase large subunit, partial [Pyrinomonadaceae bacterium]|nr:phage terminase large subunit [Pyrinomonadaceae bacterium]
LARVANGECKRLMIFMPPRHGKSELVTVRFAAWMLKNHPATNIIIGSYAQKLANRFSRKMRNVLADDGALSGGVEEKRSGGVEEEGSEGAALHDAANCEFCRAKAQKCPAAAASVSSPPPLPYSSTPMRPKNTEAEWETAEGGGVRAVGVGAGITGFGADLIIVDDPVKSRAEAESATYRDNVWGWFNDDLYTRLEPNGAIILIQTRWHEDDLAGRLLREAAEEGGEQWEVVNLPALAEHDWSAGIPACNAGSSGGMNADDDTCVDNEVASGRCGGVHAGRDACAPVTDPLGRAPGVALCPERYDVAALERVRKKLGSYSFAALYQQRPIPAEGGLFKRQWFKNIIPVAPEGLRWTRGYDLAVNNTAASDYTASYRTAYDREGNLYIDGGFRSRMEYPEQRKYILGRIREELETHQHCIELSANGNAVIQDLRRETWKLGRALRGVKPDGSKISRALPWIALAEAGKVFLIRGAWNTEFIDEACSFPAGTHDDQIDAVSIAVKMTRPRIGGRCWSI